MSSPLPIYENLVSVKKEKMLQQKSNTEHFQMCVNSDFVLDFGDVAFIFVPCSCL